MGLTLAIGAFGVALFTELGQLMNLPSGWLYAIHPNLGWISAILVAVVLVVLVVHVRDKVPGRGVVVTYAVLMVGMVLVVNYFVPYIWLRGHHHTAEFIPVPQADAMLEDDDDVFVLEIDGEARAYPRDWMMIPHIAGDTLGGEHVAMTYCALSNLPLAFDSRIDGEVGDLKVVSQVHNNLVMVNANSGQLYQQITSKSPQGDKTLDHWPAQRMPWRSFREIYPNGKVFHVVESGLLAMVDKATYALFVAGLEPHYEGPDPLFPTLRMDDDRLPPKEQIWGVNLNDEQVAYARSFLEQRPLHNTEIGGEPVLVAWFPEYETLGVFSRKVDGQTLEIAEIDVFGNTSAGKLERLPQYAHVLWMIWSHWFPETRVMA